MADYESSHLKKHVFNHGQRCANLASLEKANASIHQGDFKPTLIVVTLIMHIHDSPLAANVTPCSPLWTVLKDIGQTRERFRQSEEFKHLHNPQQL